MELKKVQLNNGVEMPEIGYGVFRVEEGKNLEAAVVTAIRTDDEMNQLNALNEDLRSGPHPDEFDF
ncbi:hypothetical protein [Bacillus ectoiniformans]|uniref:hypothetical protein n=1 Tax=Bacillus ectoiniformans TaxID=1494429 RepID=UPI00195B11E0|nr:hypothetical protein [Bacillus ectoiniformans]